MPKTIQVRERMCTKKKKKKCPRLQIERTTDMIDLL